MHDTMKALIKPTKAPGLQLVNVRVPEIEPHEVLIKVKAASICGSDIPIYNWDDPWTCNTVQPGQIIGHEFCGTVVEIGKEVNTVSVGEFVTGEGHLNCGTCGYCRRGQGHICPNQKLVGFDYPGAFAEYISIPASNIIRLQGLPIVLATILDPFGNAVHAATTISLTNATVLVTGCGPIGLMTIALAKFSRARMVIASDKSQFRLDMASVMGADLTVSPGDADIVNTVLQEVSTEFGVDVVFEMSGSPEAIVQGFKSVRPGGKVVMLGLPKREVKFDFANDLIAKGVTVHGIIGRKMYKTWEDLQKYLKGNDPNKRIDLLPIITHRLQLEDYEKGFELMRSGNCGKVILFMDENSLQESFEDLRDSKQ